MLKVEYQDGNRFLCSSNGKTIAQLKRFSEVAGSLNREAFIVASGPSTGKFPIEKYKHHPFIAMNGSILACKKNGVRPYFYICDDESFAKDRVELALQGARSALHVAMSLEVYSRLYQADKNCLDGASLFLLERANRLVGRQWLTHRAYSWSIRKDPELISKFSLFSQTANRIGFSFNMDKGYFVARTIPYVALQLCHQLGCPSVFLVGVDMTQETGRFYESGAAAAPSALEANYKKVILPSFRFVADNVTRKRGYKIYNLSLESRIPSEVFEKMDLPGLEQLLASGRG